MTDKELAEIHKKNFDEMQKLFANSIDENKELNRQLDRGVALVDGMTMQIDALKEVNDLLRDKLKKIETLVDSDVVAHRVKFILQTMFREGKWNG